MAKAYGFLEEASQRAPLHQNGPFSVPHFGCGPEYSVVGQVNTVRVAPERKVETACLSSVRFRAFGRILKMHLTIIVRAARFGVVSRPKLLDVQPLASEKPRATQSGFRRDWLGLGSV